MNEYKLTQLLIGLAILAFVFQMNARNGAFLVGVGVISWFITNAFIPKIKSFMIKKGINGFDINKKGS